MNSILEYQSHRVIIKFQFAMFQTLETVFLHQHYDTNFCDHFSHSHSWKMISNEKDQLWIINSDFFMVYSIHIPMHVLGPSPKGIKAAGLYCWLSGANLSGQNLSGSGKYCESLIRPKWDIIIAVPSVIVKSEFGIG